MIYTSCPLRLNGDNHEDVKTVSPDFPAAGYDELLGQDPGRNVPWHWHEELEAVVVREGTMRLLAPGCSLVIGEGDGVFINRDVMHSCRGEPECRIRSVTFDANLIGGGQALAITRKYLAPIVGNEAYPVVLLHASTLTGRRGCAHIEEAVRAFESGGLGFEIDVRSALSHLMLDVLEVAGEDASVERPRASVSRVSEMCRFIEEHLGEKIDVDDIARAANIGERESLRCFRQALGMTPSAYLAKQRLEHAARILLERPKEQISQVACSVGIKSASNFSLRFRRYFGCTPRAWRKRAVANQPRDAGDEM
ncbi:MAG: helix-turn-helix domain-containing protein [Coriobacteriaceae bacterium]|nr:helix-turn-helix domain-containing protein [Coriobacteriaceae bacterium]